MYILVIAKFDDINMEVVKPKSDCRKRLEMTEMEKSETQVPVSLRERFVTLESRVETMSLSLENFGPIRSCY